MKKYTRLVLVFGLFFCRSTVAQTDLTGTWQGKLAVRQNETIQFTITKQWDGSYTALFISPHNINPSTAVKFDGGRLIIDVAGLFAAPIQCP